jgi:hypothetical protein
MKRIIVSTLVIVLGISAYIYAFDSTLLDMRNRIFEESKSIKTGLSGSPDVVLLHGMWDTCLITLTQFDAYFSLLGVFNTITKENITEASVDYLIEWLTQIKNMNTLNLKSLESVPLDIQPATRGYIKKLKQYYSELNLRLEDELQKVLRLRSSLL